MNWKDISGYEGYYQISDCGQVKSCERVVEHPTVGLKTIKEKILKPNLVSGYLQVSLCKDGKHSYFKIHRLVALAFIKGDHSLTVNHIDECKTNNHVSNLEYLTRGDNIKAWIKNNPELRAEIIKKAHNTAHKLRCWERATEAISQQVLDTQTGRTFPSIKAASRYMHEEEGAKGPMVWSGKILRGKQDRFLILK